MNLIKVHTLKLKTCQMPALLSISEAAKFLGVASVTLRLWERQGKISSVRTAGGQRRYDLETLKQIKLGGQAAAASSLLNISEAAKVLGVAPVTLRLWERQGKISSVRTAGGQRRYRFEDIKGSHSESKVPVLSVSSVPVVADVSPISPIFSPDPIAYNPNFTLPLSAAQHTVLAGIASVLIIVISALALKVGFAGQIKNLAGNIKEKVGLGSAEIAEIPQRPSLGQVLASQTSLDDLLFNVNVAAKFGKTVEVIGKLTAPNIVYGVIAGPGVTVTGDKQNPVISASGSASFASVKAGDTTLTATGSGDILTFVAGTGISITGSTTNNNLTIAANSSDLNVSGWVDDGSIVRLNSVGDIVGIGTASSSAKLAIDSADSSIDLFTASESGVLMAKLNSSGLFNLAATGFTAGLKLQNSSTLFSGIGTPSNANGADGDFFFRTDAPNGNLSTYVKVSGVWTTSGGASTTLQDAYDAGSSITTSNSNDLSVTLANTAIDSNFLVNIASGSTSNFQVQNNGTAVTTLSTTGILSTGTLTLSSLASGAVYSNAGVITSEAQLNPARGGTGIGSYAVGDTLYATGGTTLGKLTIGTDGQVLTAVSGVPTWLGGSGAGTIGWFQRNSGVISPTNINDDLAIGGIATASAKFQVFGTTGSATSTGTISMNGFRLLTGYASGYALISDGSGNGNWTDISSSGTAGPWTLSGNSLFPDFATYKLLIGSVTAGDAIGQFNVSGTIAGKALAILNDTGTDQNIFTASASGITKYFLDRSGNSSQSGNITLDGTGSILTPNRQTLILGGGNSGNISTQSKFTIGNGIQMAAGAGSGFILVSDSVGNGSWTDLTTTGNIGPWTLTGTILYPDSATYQLLIGSATTSDAMGTFTVSGSKGGLATATINSTSTDQNVLTASASGVTKFNITQTGDVQIYDGTNLNIYNPSFGYGLSNFTDGGAFETIINGRINGSAATTANIAIGGTVTGNTAGSNFNVVIGPGSGTFVSGAVSSNVVIGKTASITDSDMSVALGFGASITGSNNTIALGNNRGKVTIGHPATSSTPSATLDVFGTVGTLPVASISGATTFASMVVDQSGSGDIFTASKSGSTKFVVNNNGNLQFTGTTNFLNTLTSIATAARTFTFPDASGTVCISGSTCASSGTLGYWQRTGTTLAPSTLTDSLALGVTTALATMDVRGNSATTAIASVSGSTNFAAMVIDNSGSGDIFTASKSGVTRFVITSAGNVGIGTATPTNRFAVTGQPGAGSNALAMFNQIDLTGDILTASAGGATRFTLASDGSATQSATTLSGVGYTLNANSLTSGTGLFLSSTSTALTSGSLLSGYWNPGSSTTNTGNIFNFNVGANALIAGNIFSVQDNASDLFTVNQAQITANLPTSFTSVGDVSMAYDLQFNNPTASYINSIAPLYLQAGENFNSSDLTLRTFNAGNVIVDSQAFVTNFAATVSSQLVVGTTAPANIGGFYLTNSSTFGKALAILNQTESNDILTGSASGITKFVVNNTGNIQFTGNTAFLNTMTSAATAARTYTFPDATGTICVSGSTCASSGTLGYWSRTGTTLSPSTLTDSVGLGVATALATLDVRGNSATTPVASVSGSTNFVAMVVDNTGTGDIFTASKSGATKFVITNAGQLDVLTPGVLSNSAVKLEGTWVTSGGTATTTKPMFLIEPTGTTSTAWSTAGTGIGENAASGFVGNLIDLQIAGVSAMSLLTSTGSTFTVGGGTTANTKQAVILNTAGSNNARYSVSTGTASTYIDFNSAGTTTISSGGGTNIVANIGNTFTWTGTTRPGGVPLVSATPGNHSAMVSEAIDYSYLTHTNTITGSYATQRFANYAQATITAGSALSISTEADTLNIAGPPIAAGSATIANAIGLRIASGTSVTSAVTNAFGLYVDAPTGATNNYAATFATGRVGISTTAPLATLDVRANSATTAIASISGSTNYASLVADNFGSGDIFTASQSGWTRFKIAGDGSISQIANTTTGTAYSMALNSLTTGTGLSLSSTAIGLTTGTLANFDWSPTTPSTNSGNLFNINVGALADVGGSYFNISDTGTSLFSVSDAAVTTSLPTAFNAPGDVSVAYDLQFTNQTASYIKSNAPLYLQAGETFESNNLTLQTYNSGKAVLDLAGGAVLNQSQTWTFGTGTLQFDNTNARIGIGTTTPLASLHVTDSQTATATAFISNTNTAAGITGLAIKLSSTTLDTTSRFINFLDKNGTRIGKINAANTTTVAYSANGTDFAEYFTKDNSTLDVGTIVSLSGSDATNSNTAYDPTMIGIVSNTASFVGGIEGSNKVLVALTGQVPVKVAASSPAIHKGDFVTSSPVLGKATKAVKPGFVIGKALEDWNPGGSDQVMVTLNNIWADPMNSLDTTNIAALGTSINNLGLSMQTMDAQIASLSAQLNNLQVLMDPASSMSAELWQVSTESGKLTTALGVQVPELTVNGKLSVGLLSFDDIDASITSLTGVVTVNGDLAVSGTIRVLGQSAGRDIIPIGATTLTITNSNVATSSAIFATPEKVPVAVSTESTQSGKFVIRLAAPQLTNTTVNWWIVN